MDGYHGSIEDVAPHAWTHVDVAEPVRLGLDTVNRLVYWVDPHRNMLGTANYDAMQM